MNTLVGLRPYWRGSSGGEDSGAKNRRLADMTSRPGIISVYQLLGFGLCTGAVSTGFSTGASWGLSYLSSILWLLL